ncbi:MAG TPA: hypothetical protein DER60_01985, partial [Syntrophomonas sp.]|nr:hypothetical protein [Syntrophomonas sp.]
MDKPLRALKLRLSCDDIYLKGIYHIQERCFAVRIRGLLIILLLFALSGCGTESRYPDTDRLETAASSVEVMQGLEKTVKDILEAQKAANSDLRELQQLTISTRQYYSNAPNDSSYGEARIDLLTEEDIAFVREALIAQGYMPADRQDAQAWEEALSAYQDQAGLPLSGRLDA